jgi:hypothetical protein
LKIIREVFRAERQSYKLDLSLNGNYVIELFSFPNPPKRVSRPEATGLRHLAFEVDNIETTVDFLTSKNAIPEPVRIDEFTGKNLRSSMIRMVYPLNSTSVDQLENHKRQLIGNILKGVV